MNHLRGTIINISVNGNLTLIDLNVAGENFKAIVIETPDTLDFLKEDKEVSVMFKETEVIIGKKQEHAISLRHRLMCTIRRIDQGPLLSKLVMEHKAGEVRSIITSNAVGA